jgi:protein MAK11
MKYVSLDPSAEDGEELLALSTEDGRVIFYSTKRLQKAADDDESPIPYAEAVAELGGRTSGFPGRVKDFEILNVGEESAAQKGDLLVVTGNSEGVVRVWMLRAKDLIRNTKEKPTSDDKSEGSGNLQVGKLLNVYETGNRITCLKAFVMLPPDPSTSDDFDESSEDEIEEEEDEEESSEGSDEE